MYSLNFVMVCTVVFSFPFQLITFPSHPGEESIVFNYGEFVSFPGALSLLMLMSPRSPFDLMFLIYYHKVEVD